VVELLLCKYKAPSSNPSLTKKKKLFVFIDDYFIYLIISRIMQYLSFVITSLSIVYSKVIHIVAHNRISFFFKAK
jgi:hypothetical protein